MSAIGALTIVITGVVVELATVALALAEVTLVTVPLHQPQVALSVVHVRERFVPRVISSSAQVPAVHLPRSLFVPIVIQELAAAQTLAFSESSSLIAACTSVADIFHAGVFTTAEAGGVLTDVIFSLNVVDASNAISFQVNAQDVDGFLSIDSLLILANQLSVIAVIFVFVMEETKYYFLL